MNARYAMGFAAAVLLPSGVALGGTSVFDMVPGLKSLELVTVGDPWNEADTVVMRDRLATPGNTSGYGSVAYTYRIGKYDVTGAQYCQFLNAVARSDPYGLYNPLMLTDTVGCGISRSGGSGSYSYSLTKNGNYPVSRVSWGDAARFCNWLTNGQRSDPVTTEYGFYALNGATSNAALSAVTRSDGARFALPSEDEWYKAGRIQV